MWMGREREGVLGRFTISSEARYAGSLPWSQGVRKTWRELGLCPTEKGDRPQDGQDQCEARCLKDT